MQILFFAAGVLAALTGVVHSVLGERLIFRFLRQGSFVPTTSTPPLRESHIRILWATWHVGSVFGWAFAGILLHLAFAPLDTSLSQFVLSAIVSSYFGASMLVLVGTKGQHPGWIALLLVAVSAWAASHLTT